MYQQRLEVLPTVIFTTKLNTAKSIELGLSTLIFVYKKLLLTSYFILRPILDYEMIELTNRNNTNWNSKP